jgi:CheY-like chemotaxis protein
MVNNMTDADQAPRLSPSPEERSRAFQELVGLIMSERSEKHGKIMENLRNTFKPPPGEWQAKKWIVILSDDERVRDQVAKILEGQHLFVKTFDLTTDAFKSMDAAFYLEDGKLPNLVAIDAYMAELGGLEFFRELRQRTAYADVPVVMLVRGDEMPAVPFIFNVSEPIDARALLEFVHREATV